MLGSGLAFDLDFGLAGSAVGEDWAVERERESAVAALGLTAAVVAEGIIIPEKAKKKEETYVVHRAGSGAP